MADAMRKMRWIDHARVWARAQGQEGAYQDLSLKGDFLWIRIRFGQIERRRFET